MHNPTVTVLLNITTVLSYSKWWHDPYVFLQGVHLFPTHLGARLHETSRAAGTGTWHKLTCTYPSSTIRLNHKIALEKIITPFIRQFLVPWFVAFIRFHHCHSGWAAHHSSLPSIIADSNKWEPILTFPLHLLHNPFPSCS